ncbi:MAG: nucleotidyltransferase, partial [Candidatus Calescibacterium sp.]
MEAKELLKKIAKSLSKEGIEYMIIGGQAVLIYGEPRLTKDIDITLGINVDGLEKILEIVRKLKLKL